jgi:hypothetical protein
MDRFKSGNPVIQYDDAGRVLWTQSRPAAPLPRPLMDAEPKNTLTGGWRRFFTRREESDQAYDRRYDWMSSDQQPIEPREDVIVEKRQRDGVMVEDRLVYKEKPRFWWLFVILAILLLILGVVNLLFCLDFHWYSRFYTGLFVSIRIQSRNAAAFDIFTSRCLGSHLGNSRAAP